MQRRGQKNGENFGKPPAGDPWIWAAPVTPRTVGVVIAMTQVMQKTVK